MKFIITAGGQGTKLWPYSREAEPKQFQKVVGDTSLYTYTVNLLLRQYPPEDLFVSIKQRYLPIALQQAPQIPTTNYIIEPDIPKDRGPAEGLAFLTLSLLHPEEPFMIIQPDCMRLPEEKFLSMIVDTEKLVKRDKKYISGGNKATYPTLGIDYLKLGNKIPLDSPLEVFQVKEFMGRTEDYYKTKELIENFYITTHSNHSCWYPDQMLEAYAEHRPDWYEGLMNIKKFYNQPSKSDKVEKIYANMEKGPTEMVTQHIFPSGYIVLLPFRWIDFGAWNSVYEYFTKADEVYTDGNVVAINSKRSLIKSGNQNKLIAVLGIEDLIVVDTNDILLIIPKDKSDQIKSILTHLKDTDRHNFL